MTQPFGLAQDSGARKRVPASSTCVIASCCLACSGLHARYTVHSMVLTDSLSDTNTSGIPFSCTCPVYRWWSWLLLWTRQDQERFYVSSATMVIKTELCQYTEYRIRTQISRVHSPVVKAADCRSAGPWFNSGWRTLFTFVTWYDKLTSHDFLMINIMSPITTSIRTITRKSVNRFRNFCDFFFEIFLHDFQIKSKLRSVKEISGQNLAMNLTQ